MNKSIVLFAIAYAFCQLQAHWLPVHVSICQFGHSQSPTSFNFTQSMSKYHLSASQLRDKHIEWTRINKQIRYESNAYCVTIYRSDNTFLRLVAMPSEHIYAATESNSEPPKWFALLKSFSSSHYINMHWDDHRLPVQCISLYFCHSFSLRLYVWIVFGLKAIEWENRQRAHNSIQKIHTKL